MTLLTPFYLALGDCVLEDGTGELDYHVQAMSFPEPEPDGQGGHYPATRGIALRVEGATIASLNSNIAALRREAVKDKLLRFRPSGSGDVLECRIRSASIVEDSYEPLERSRTSEPKTNLTINIVTDPYWLAPWEPDQKVTLTTVPSVFDVHDVKGEHDAPVQMRAIYSNNGTVAAIGVRPDPVGEEDLATGIGTDEDENGTSDGYTVAGDATAAMSMDAEGYYWQRFIDTAGSTDEVNQLTHTTSFSAEEGDVFLGQAVIWGWKDGSVTVQVQIEALSAADAVLAYATTTCSSFSTTPTLYTVRMTCPANTAKVRWRPLRVSTATIGHTLHIYVGKDHLTRLSYYPVDDYGQTGDTVDANALGGYKVGLSATADHAAIGTAPTLDTQAHAGRHLLLVRADSDAASPANVTLKPRSTVTGYQISGTTNVDGAAVATSSGNLIGYELGEVQIPCAQTPGVGVTSGWSSETAQVSQSTDSGTLTLTSAASGSYHYIEGVQTFPTFDGRVTALEYTIDVAPSLSVTSLLRLTNEDNVVVSSQYTVPTTVGTHKVTLPTPIKTVAGKTYKMTLLLQASSSFTVGVAYGNNTYTGGTFATYLGSGEDADDDLVFSIYGQTRIGFLSSTPVLAACTESSKTVNLDYVQRIPVGYAALVYRRGSSGSLALFYDGDTDTPYIADADGIGAALYDKCEIRKPLRLKPGVVNRVVVGALQADEALSGATITYSYRPRYLTATGS